ncbi:MAG: hypothetical protein MUF48_21045, partial [Pirellulaceae bacterium]|nr:hypothetical protein [Pirellulaceae bacterium]
GEPRSSATCGQHATHPLLPHRLARWGAEIIGYELGGLPVLATGGKPIIGYVRPAPHRAAES